MEQEQNNPNLKSLTRKYTIKANKNRFFYPDEYLKFYEMLKLKQRHTARVLINTGARINEARHITPSDIDFANRRLVLRVTKGKKDKSKWKIRTIPISSEFSRYLKKFCEKLKADDTIKLLSTPAMDIAMKKACQKADIKDWQDFSAHNIRKTLETWLLALRVDSMSLLAHFGHDYRTAAQHYISPDVFTHKEKETIREIISDLYEK